MSLVNTLGKMALGMIAAKLTGNSGNSGGGLLGSLLGSLTNRGGDGLDDLFGSQQQSRGGLGDLLGKLTNRQSGSSGGGLGGLLGGLLGGNSQSAGQQSSGLGGLLDSLGNATHQTGSGNSGSLGGLLNAVFQGVNKVRGTDEQEKQAEVMLRAMISAAKADGDIDADEQRKITEHLDDDGTTNEEIALVKQIMKEPLNTQSLINSVPKGMEEQVYLMSLLAINLDSKREAMYLDQLAKGLSLSNQQCNAIHEKLGAPVLYN